MVTPSDQQNDPTELLDVLDARGAPTGVALARAEIHRRGLWHRAFHCWIVRSGAGGLEIVLQQRSQRKDTFPGRWDAAAAGHWRSGETAREAAREVAEELGIAVPFDRLARVGTERIVRRHANGLVDREIHEVYVLEWQAPLKAYQPDPAEVAALAAVPARALVALAAGRLVAVPATEAVVVRPDGSLQPRRLQLTSTTCVPYSAARLRRLLRAAALGRPPVHQTEVGPAGSAGAGGSLPGTI